MSHVRFIVGGRKLMGHLRSCYACVTQGGCSRHTGGNTYTRPAVEGLRGDVLFHEALVEFDLMAMSRSKAAVDGAGPQWVDEEFMVEYPALAEFMRETVWEDGKVRRTGTLLIVAEGRVIKCSIHDRDGRRSAWITADTVKTLFARCDAALASDGLEWRKDTR